LCEINGNICLWACVNLPICVWVNRIFTGFAFSLWDMNWGWWNCWPLSLQNNIHNSTRWQHYYGLTFLALRIEWSCQCQWSSIWMLWQPFVLQLYDWLCYVYYCFIQQQSCYNIAAGSKRVGLNWNIKSWRSRLVFDSDWLNIWNMGLFNFINERNTTFWQLGNILRVTTL
jgi:hypothetical protein